LALYTWLDGMGVYLPHRSLGRVTAAWSWRTSTERSPGAPRRRASRLHSGFWGRI